jgi:hypothetical protein
MHPVSRLGASRGRWLQAPHRTDRPTPPKSLACCCPNAASWRADSNRPTAGAGWLTGDAPCEPLRRPAAGDGYKARTEPIVLHRRNH